MVDLLDLVKSMSPYPVQPADPLFDSFRRQGKIKVDYSVGKLKIQPFFSSAVAYQDGGLSY